MAKAGFAKVFFAEPIPKLGLLITFDGPLLKPVGPAVGRITGFDGCGLAAGASPILPISLSMKSSISCYTNVDFEQVRWRLT